MKRIGKLLGLFAIAGAGFCGTRSLTIGDADRGKEVFRTRRCIACHSINGEGGKSAPELGRIVERGFSPYSLAGRLWNHAPVMWAAMEREGIARPELSQQEAADLFAYFFAARYFESPGTARRGRQLFRSKRCAGCHGIESPVREGIRPVAAWQSMEDPIALACEMWNHSFAMRRELDRSHIPYPQLSSQELTDVLVYLRGRVGNRGRSAEFSPASAVDGQTVFAVKGCAVCHTGGRALEARPTRYSLTDFAAAMWNHPFRISNRPPQLSYEEMRRLVGYLVSMQFFEERGDLERGKGVFAAKRCGACHDNPSSGAPARAALAGKMTSFDLVAALWKHGPAMLDRMRQQKVAWPQFAGTEMADLTAYLHGAELKHR
jgi:mono/diheme cytochrome c family protein